MQRYLSLESAPLSTDLTTLARLKQELSIVASDEDALLSSMIASASERVSAMLVLEGEDPRTLYRSQWKETFWPVETHTFTVLRPPVASIDAVEQGNASVDVSGFAILDRARGVIERVNVDFNPESRWEITYTGGYFLPGDDYTGDVAADSGASQYTGTSLPVTHLKAGDLFYANGFTNSANNGLKTVVTATSSAITVSESLVTEAAASRTLGFRNLPGPIEDACLALAARAYSERGTSGISRLRVADAIDVSFGSSGRSEYAMVEEMLSPWRTTTGLRSVHLARA